MSAIKRNWSCYEQPGSKVEAKLSWISTFSSLLLFQQGIWAQKQQPTSQTRLFTAAVTQQLCSAVWVTSGREWSIIWLPSQDTAGSYRDNVTALGWQCCHVLVLVFSFHKHCPRNRKCVGRDHKVLSRLPIWALAGVIKAMTWLNTRKITASNPSEGPGDPESYQRTHAHGYTHTQLLMWLHKRVWFLFAGTIEAKHGSL